MKTVFKTIILTLAIAATSCQESADSFYVASNRADAPLYTLQDNVLVEAATAYRGAFLKSGGEDDIRFNSEPYKSVKVGKTRYYIAESNTCADTLSSVLEQVVYVRTSASMIADTTRSTIACNLPKGARLEVKGFNNLDSEGVVNRYKVEYKGKTGYVFGKYCVPTLEEAKLTYMPEVYDSLHREARNRFGGGSALGCDFFPRKKPKFENNRMPESCYSLYINFAPGNLSKIDEYIKLAKSTKINTFVIDIKDNECPGYKADAMYRYSPTNYARASKNGVNLYTNAVKRLHEEGFYVVGRITCFKDTYFIKDNPESAITDIETDEPFYHNKSYWPSAYDRRVWEFNVELAKESIRRFGFDEINFDYVRFPDRMTKIEGRINYHNKYDESKVQAIQRFVQYAVDEIHALGAYVSIDVFGESANPGYTTAYGQYWPALSNIADVMCGMPYPDHFPDGFYGVSKPWNHPYQLLYRWGQRVQARQNSTPSPAIVRTWVQAYHVMRHVDPNGIDYNAENVEKEIRGLFDAGLTGGYIPWLSSSNLERYCNQAPAWSIDYLAEYKTANAQPRTPIEPLEKLDSIPFKGL